jgi:hypothetical protein
VERGDSIGESKARSFTVTYRNDSHLDVIKYALPAAKFLSRIRPNDRRGLLNSSCGLSATAISHAGGIAPHCLMVDAD